MRIIPFLHIKNPTFSNSLQVQIGRVWSEWQDLNLRPLPPQAKGDGFLRDIASNTCFFVRKNWYKVRRVLLSPGSPVLKVVKHVVIKSAPNLMWSGIKGADNFLYGNCGQSMWSVSIGFRHLRLSYCNSSSASCQEVSGIKSWDAVDKEKDKGIHMVI